MDCVYKLAIAAHILLIFMKDVYISDCQCVLPMPKGNWITSSRGTWVVPQNRTQIQKFRTSFTIRQYSDLDCISKSDKYYILGASVQVFGNTFVSAYTCVDIRTTTQSPNKYEMYFLTVIDLASGEPFSTNIATSCDGAVNETAANTVIVIAEGSTTNDIKTILPHIVRGVYDITFIDENGLYSNNSQLAAIADKTVFQITQVRNATSSTSNIAYSENGKLYCVKAWQWEAVTYIYTFNKDITVDLSSTYIFSCWAVEANPDSYIIFVTVAQDVCKYGQTPTHAPDGVQSMMLELSATCTDFVQQVPTFMQCQYRCHCKRDVQCHETTGECPNGCEFGWMGPGCQYPTCTDFVQQVPTFMQCQYRCHCKDDVQCHETTGECRNGCEFGWMGPGCQYRNIAKYSVFTKMVDSGENDKHTAENAVDGNGATCLTTVVTPNRTQKWYTQFNRTYEVIGVIIKVSPEDVETFRNFRIETSEILDDTRFPTLCYHHTNTPISTTMEIMCNQPTKMRQLRIKLDKPDVPLSLCEVEIYGGRSITFNKPASQITTHSTSNTFSSNASRALDGRTPTAATIYADRTCSATYYNYNPWWRVDLGAQYILYEVQFFGRLDFFHQFRGFHLLYGQNNSTFTELYHDISTSNYNMTYQPLKIPINTTFNARFLKIQLNSIQKVLLAICEVIAFAECQSNQCGWDCSMKCFCSSETTGSYKIAATCPIGCQGRWTGVGGKCDNECELSEWGTQCENKCGHCRWNSTCHVTTGKCEEGCSGPWEPPLCTEECSNFTYGINCSLDCGKCKNRTSCNTTDGTCAYGCEPRWEPPTCNEPISNNGIDSFDETPIIIGVVVGFIIAIIVVGVVVTRAVWKRRINRDNETAETETVHRAEDFTLTNISNQTDNIEEGNDANLNVVYEQIDDESDVQQAAGQGSEYEQLKPRNADETNYSSLGIQDDNNEIDRCYENLKTK